MFNQLNKLRDIDECEQHKYATNPARGFHSDLLAELHNASALAGNCGVKLSSLLRLGSPTQEAFESGDFIIGGCIVQGDGSDPKYGCQSCSWTGNYKNRKLISSEVQSDS